MKKVITMVGTSLFENYIEKNDDRNFKNAYNYFKNNKINAENLDSELDRRRNIERALNETWFRKNKQNASAEIKSLIKLKEELNEDFEIHLLYSDTALSRLAAEILQKAITQYYDEFKKDKVEIKKIENLQIWDRDKFIKDGMTNLIKTIYDIANYDWQNVIINITGGYKATIPYLTILGQVNKCPIYYIFEDTDATIKIPYVPIDIKWRVFEENEGFFMDLERKNISELPAGINFRDEVQSLLEIVDNLYTLNPLGVTLWKKYKERFVFFYISPVIDNYIQKNQERKTIIEKSFLELYRRLYSNPDNPDLDHRISGWQPPERFKIFKHKEENLQVRILYRADKWKTGYGSTEYSIYIGLIAIGQEVHNVESEYIVSFKQNQKRIDNLNEYKIYKIKKEVSHV